MSLFLGYIHHLMFSKIKFLDNLTDRLIEEIEIDNKEDLVDGIYKFNLEEGELEDIIDTNNIHGWLDERVSRVETKFAFFISEILKRDESKISILKDKMNEIGREESIKFSSAKEVYQFITSKFLDGMPCDGSLMLLTNEDNQVIFKVLRDVHREIWEDFYDYKVYWSLRDSYIDGLLKDSKFILKREDENYKIGEI